MDFWDKARQFADQHDEQVDQAIEKAADELDRRTGGKHTNAIDKAANEAQKRTGAGDTVP